MGAYIPIWKIGFRDSNVKKVGSLTAVGHVDETLDKHITEKITGKDTVFHYRNSDTWHSLAYNFDQGYDEFREGSFDAWKDNGIQGPIDVVPTSPEIGIGVEADGEMSTYNSVINLPMNKVGIYFSKMEEAMRTIKSVVYDKLGGVNDITASYISFLHSKGFTSPRNIDYLVVANRDDMHAGVLKLSDESAALIFPKNFNDGIDSAVAALGIEDRQKYIDHVLYHELHHIFEGEGSEAEIEAALTSHLAEFYSWLASQTDGEDSKDNSTIAKFNSSRSAKWKENGTLESKLDTDVEGVSDSEAVNYESESPDGNYDNSSDEAPEGDSESSE
jgi:hypothetical protein